MQEIYTKTYITPSYLLDILSNAAGLTAEEKLSRHVLRSSFKAEPKNPKVNRFIDTLTYKLNFFFKELKLSF